MINSNKRLRILRGDRMRAFAQEHTVSINDICHPVFIKEGILGAEEIPAMPDVYSHCTQSAIEEIGSAVDLGIRHFVLRPVPSKESRDVVSKSIQFECEAISAIRNSFPDVTILVDGYFGQTRSDGYYGPKEEDPILEERNCLKEICEHALAHADSGADFVISLGRVDNSVLSLRQALDQNGLINIGILAYSINFSSTLAHAMMRDKNAVSKAAVQTNKSKIAVGNIGDAIRQANLEISQGADIVGVKPATIFTDAVSRLSAEVEAPIATYIVSKEYSMVKAAAEKGWVSEKDTAIEYFLSLKRAGANRIFSYWARDYARWIIRGDLY